MRGTQRRQRESNQITNSIYCLAFCIAYEESLPSPSSEPSLSQGCLPLGLIYWACTGPAEEGAGEVEKGESVGFSVHSSETLPSSTAPVPDLPLPRQHPSEGESKGEETRVISGGFFATFSLENEAPQAHWKTVLPQNRVQREKEGDTHVML